MSHEPRANWVEVDEKKEASIYSYYRRQLRGLRKSRTRSPAGEKKQRAREAAAKNFSVPHSQVKSIVTQLQLEAGVPSVHDDPRHQRRVAYHTAGQALMDESSKDDKGNLICSCGSKDGVAVRPHPVAMEIHRRLQPVLLCRECYEVLAEDI